MTFEFESGKKLSRGYNSALWTLRPYKTMLAIYVRRLQGSLIANVGLDAGIAGLPQSCLRALIPMNYVLISPSNHVLFVNLQPLNWN